jgi:hypothetical protein
MPSRPEHLHDYGLDERDRRGLSLDEDLVVRTNTDRVLDQDLGELGDARVEHRNSSFV